MTTSGSVNSAALGYRQFCPISPTIFPLRATIFSTSKYTLGRHLIESAIEAFTETPDRPASLNKRMYTQHGPAQLLGPPYVYSYRHGNVTDLIDKINEATMRPIEQL